MNVTIKFEEEGPPDSTSTNEYKPRRKPKPELIFSQNLLQPFKIKSYTCLKCCKKVEVLPGSYLQKVDSTLQNPCTLLLCCDCYQERIQCHVVPDDSSSGENLDPKKVLENIQNGISNETKEEAINNEDMLHVLALEKSQVKQEQESPADAASAALEQQNCEPLVDPVDPVPVLEVKPKLKSIEELPSAAAAANSSVNSEKTETVISNPATTTEISENLDEKVTRDDPTTVPIPIVLNGVLTSDVRPQLGSTEPGSTESTTQLEIVDLKPQLELSLPTPVAVAVATTASVKNDKAPVVVPGRINLTEKACEIIIQERKQRATDLKSSSPKSISQSSLLVSAAAAAAGGSLQPKIETSSPPLPQAKNIKPTLESDEMPPNWLNWTQSVKKLKSKLENIVIPSFPIEPTPTPAPTTTSSAATPQPVLPASDNSDSTTPTATAAPIRDMFPNVIPLLHFLPTQMTTTTQSPKIEITTRPSPEPERPSEPPELPKVKFEEILAKAKSSTETQLLEYPLSMDDQDLSPDLEVESVDWFKCPTCPEKRFLNQIALDDHLKDFHQGSDLYSCQHCDKTFLLFSSFMAHKTVHAAMIEYLCKYCGTEFLFENEYYAHLLLHRITNFKCHECEENFPSKAALVLHTSAGHGHGAGAGSTSKSQKAHAHTHAQVQAQPSSSTQPAAAAKCSKCDSTFEDSISLAKHFNCEHGKGKMKKHFEPTSKPKPTSSNSAASAKKQHQNGAKKAIGGHLPKTTTLTLTPTPTPSSSQGQPRPRRTRMRRWIPRNKIKSTEFSCPTCQVNCPSLKYLQRHAATHTEIIFKCHVCAKGYVNRAPLERHLQTAHSASEYRPYACSTCHKAFKMRCQLKSHEETHSTEKPFNCEACGKAFLNKSYVRCHFRYAHMGIKNYLIAKQKKIAVATAAARLASTSSSSEERAESAVENSSQVSATPTPTSDSDPANPAPVPALNLKNDEIKSAAAGQAKPIPIPDSIQITVQPKSQSLKKVKDVNAVVVVKEPKKPKPGEFRKPALPAAAAAATATAAPAPVPKPKRKYTKRAKKFFPGAQVQVEGGNENGQNGNYFFEVQGPTNSSENGNGNSSEGERDGDIRRSGRVRKTSKRYQ